eukprot:scaffold17029_cov135-Isochrysis_galbana.AAC.3
MAAPAHVPGKAEQGGGGRYGSRAGSPGLAPVVTASGLFIPRERPARVGGVKAAMSCPKAPPAAQLCLASASMSARCCPPRRSQTRA